MNKEMSETASCLGMVKNPDGTYRPCSRSGNSVLANGYCASHQVIAISKILEQLKAAEVELGKWEQKRDDQKIREAQLLVATLKSQLDGARKICDTDQDCSVQLKDLLVTLHQLSRRTDINTKPLQKVEQKLTQLVKSGRPEDAQAFQISRDWELAQRDQEATEALITKLKTELQECAAKAQAQDRKWNDTMANWANEMKKQEANRQQCQETVKSLQEQIDLAKAGSANVSGVYTKTISDLQQQVKQYQDMYNEMKARELKTSKSLDQLTKTEQDLQKAIEELKQSYEKQLTSMREKFAEQVRAGGTILSEREEQLQKEVERLKADLELALNDLELATNAGREAINRVANTNLPYGTLAQELMDVNTRLKTKNEELGKLQVLYDKKVEDFARAEMDVANRIDQATSRDRSEIVRLSKDLHTAEKNVTQLRQEILGLNNQVYELRRAHENEVQTIQRRLREASTMLAEQKALRASDLRSLDTQKQALIHQKQTEQSQREFQFNQIKDRLQKDYHDKIRVLQDRADATQAQMERERRSLAGNQKQLRDMSEEMRRQKDNMERYRNDFEKKMAEFEAQRLGLTNALTQAKEQAQAFSKIEAEYKKRVEVLRQNIAVQKQQYEARIHDLNERLTKAVANQNQTARALEKCSAARDGVALRVTNLVEENQQLKDRYTELKTKMDVMRAQYETTMQKIQMQNAKLQQNAKEYASQLQDATLAHDHVLRLKDEMKELQNRFQETVLKAQGNEQSLKRLLQDREVEQQQVIRLQSALQQCNQQKTQAQAGMDSTASQLREVKRMNTDLSGEVSKLANQYTGAIQDREAQMTRAQMEAQVREESLRRQLAELDVRNKQTTDQLKRAENAKILSLDALANASIDSANQIALLTEAAKMSRPGYKNTGKSDLLSV